GKRTAAAGQPGVERWQVAARLYLSASTIGNAVFLDGTAAGMGARIRALGPQGGGAADGVDGHPRPVHLVLSAALPRPPERDRFCRAPRLAVCRSTSAGAEFPDQ